MSAFQEYNWVCSDCDYEAVEYGPAYTCPSCGSHEYYLSDEQEDEDDE